MEMRRVQGKAKLHLFGMVCFSILLCASTVYAACLQGDCKNGQGVLVHEDGRRYSGEFLSGAIHGRGILKYPNGIEYSGEFQKGRYHGKGVLTSPDGRKYEGEFRGNVINGQGVVTYADGTQ